jgi:hypothetical protein
VAVQYDLFHYCTSVTQNGYGCCQLHKTLVTFKNIHDTRSVLPKRCPAKPWRSVNEKSVPQEYFWIIEILTYSMEQSFLRS